MKKRLFSPKAVIFDMDGVLVDSMPYHYISWYETLRPLGVQASAFDIYEREGEVWHKTLKDLLKRAGIKPNRKLLLETVRKKYKLFRRYFKRHIFKGADEFIFCLKKKGYRLGLVTGTPLPEVKKILPKKMFSAFDAVVTGDIVRKGKPHPEPYLKASAFLGVRPQDCAVIENAPLGIRAAKRALMKCFAVTTSLPRQYLKEADIIVDRLEDIIKMIGPFCDA